MVPRTLVSLASLYEADETAWLDVMSRLAAERRVDEFDFDNLSEFLESMARRDRREVKSRLVVLLMHRLKWEHQPDRRSGSWRSTILTQQDELKDLLDSLTLRDHAVDCLADAYRRARDIAAAETGLPIETFPAQSTLTVDGLLDDLA